MEKTKLQMVIEFQDCLDPRVVKPLVRRAIPLDLGSVEHTLQRADSCMVYVGNPSKELHIVDVLGFPDLLQDHIVTYLGLLTVSDLCRIAQEYDRYGMGYAFWYAQRYYTKKCGSFAAEYRGEYSSVQSFCKDYHQRQTGLPCSTYDHWPYTCIDWGMAWQKLEMEGYWAGEDRSSDEGGWHIFGPSTTGQEG